MRVSNVTGARAHTMKSAPGERAQAMRRVTGAGSLRLGRRRSGKETAAVGRRDRRDGLGRRRRGGWEAPPLSWRGAPRAGEAPPLGLPGSDGQAAQVVPLAGSLPSRTYASTVCMTQALPVR